LLRLFPSPDPTVGGTGSAFFFYRQILPHLGLTVRQPQTGSGGQGQRPGPWRAAGGRRGAAVRGSRPAPCAAPELRSGMGGLVRYAGDGMGGRLQPLAACGAAVAGGVAPAELLASSVPCPHLLGSLPPLVRCGCGRALVRGFGEQGDGQASRTEDSLLG
jgi:hypothetical protein